MTGGPLWRIRDRATFVELRRAGLRRRAGPVVVTWVPGAAGTPPRVAYVVGRRLGGAVRRNRLRRRLRAVVAELAGGMAPGAYLVGVEPAAAGMSHPELKASATRALSALQNEPDR